MRWLRDFIPTVVVSHSLMFHSGTVPGASYKKGRVEQAVMTCWRSAAKINMDENKYKHYP